MDYLGAHSCVILIFSSLAASQIGISLRWRHNGHDSVSNHQLHHCLRNRLVGCRSKKTSKLRVTGLCVGNSPETGEFPHKWPVTRKMFPFDDVIMSTPKWHSHGYGHTTIPHSNTNNVLLVFHTYTLWEQIAYSVHLIRKSGDFVYGIWQYKVLNIKHKLFRCKKIREEI